MTHKQCHSTETLQTRIAVHTYMQIIKNTNKWVCSQKHNCICLIRCYVLRSKKLRVSAGTGHHQVLSYDSLKMILYNSCGGMFDEEISTSKPLLENDFKDIKNNCTNTAFLFTVPDFLEPGL